MALLSVASHKDDDLWKSQWNIFPVNAYESFTSQSRRSLVAPIQPPRAGVTNSARTHSKDSPKRGLSVNMAALPARPRCCLQELKNFTRWPNGPFTPPRSLQFPHVPLTTVSVLLQQKRRSGSKVRVFVPDGRKPERGDANGWRVPSSPISPPLPPRTFHPKKSSQSLETFCLVLKRELHPSINASFSQNQCFSRVSVRIHVCKHVVSSDKLVEVNVCNQRWNFKIKRSDSYGRRLGPHVYENETMSTKS